MNAEGIWPRIFGTVRPEELRSALGATLPLLARRQRELSERVAREGCVTAPAVVAGVDVSSNRFGPTVYAAVVTLRYPDMALLEEASACGEAAMPYVPGFLAFRELPILLEAWERLRQPPDLVLVDGHGVSHPRGLGIASHLGVLLDVPAIGCAKSVLVGSYREPGLRPGDWQPLVWEGRTIGIAVRTREHAKPVFVSTGHAVDLPSAIRLVLDCCRGYRLPEPTRQAHLAANRVRLRGG